MEIRQESTAQELGASKSVHPHLPLREYIDSVEEGLTLRPKMYALNEEAQEALWVTLLQLESLPLGSLGDFAMEAALKARYELGIRIPSLIGIANQGKHPLPPGITMATVYKRALKIVREKVLVDRSS